MRSFFLSQILICGVPALLALGCQPAAFPRTGEVVPPRALATDAHLQVVNWEPQRVSLPDGRKLRSNVAWYPILSAAVRVGLGPCEVGGLYQLTRVGAEARCGLVQERLGHPLSIAYSGLLALDYGPTTAAFTRIGLDISRRFGPIAALVDVYFSTGDALRWMQDPGVHPIEGPLPGAQSIVRRELRVTIPFGLAVRLAHTGSEQQGRAKGSWVSLVLGATPWFLLARGPCFEEVGACTTLWNGEHGVGFTSGIEIR